MKIVIKPRLDDGSFDLFERRPSGDLDFLSNHPNLEEARRERDTYSQPMSQGDTLAFFHDLQQALQRS